MESKILGQQHKTPEEIQQCVFDLHSKGIFGDEGVKRNIETLSAFIETLRSTYEQEALQKTRIYFIISGSECLDENLPFDLTGEPITIAFLKLYNELTSQSER